VHVIGNILEDRGAEVAVVLLTPEPQGNGCRLDDTQMGPFLRHGVSSGPVQSKPGFFAVTFTQMVGRCGLAATSSLLPVSTEAQHPGVSTLPGRSGPGGEPPIPHGQAP
jgi:hypothetical protein